MARMLDSLVKKQLERVMIPQPLHVFSQGKWLSKTGPWPSTTTQSLKTEYLDQLHLISWNIDFQTPYPRARMASALKYIEGLVAQVPSSSAICIFFQEMREVTGNREPDIEQQANDLSQIANASWVQERFHMTDLDLSNWASHYGQVTLIDRRLSVAQVSRVELVSEFRRDALLVDIRLGEGEDVLRLCNVHLDSLTGNLRPVQWKGLAKLLQDKEGGVAGSLLAGDCNATQTRDRTEPQQNGFKDAYLELGGEEGDENGATWGFQSRSGKRFGRQRLDKVATWGVVQARGLERIGAGVCVEDEVFAKALIEDTGFPFVTDHYGLMCTVDVHGGMKSTGSLP
ncbi:hypothetical protein BU24DRAFT_427931 [Aaosphaeria arxii CBS 175.79]|uniref:Endonuclease/exonuclease/phosphatase domain-containing protein n=1 Tax=Aaosphaeria arxii CBS 175.79 TaxID=1450172 RepID=A0A6A5XAT8_9PLEO|nr:uncharacterized protein BU24DRAFT_427931 [Aaosphaeria arxii CBS 175.79]KAF2009897.1 hypothetical protein BU24DRAFT_427931 [Aaosphaeria arxii CBS 175.79]